MKQISHILRSNDIHMVGNGFKVENYFPREELPLSTFSPFVLLDYNAPFYFPPLLSGKRGVGAHPHRGFETVTLVYEGSLAHRDSVGNRGIMGPGDVQWMTAGSGVLHEEFQEENFTRQGGILHAVQLWVNLPAKDKMSKPKYQTLLAGSMGRVSLDDEGSFLRVIAGSYKGVSGPASTFTPVELYDVFLQKRGALTFDLPAGYNTMILVLKGEIKVNQRPASTKDLILFAHQGEQVEIVADSESLFLILSGDPIHEPVIQSGPFVMNTEAEIGQAHRDFASGQFGSL